MHKVTARNDLQLWIRGEDVSLKDIAFLERKVLYDYYLENYSLLKRKIHS